MHSILYKSILFSVTIVYIFIIQYFLIMSIYAAEKYNRKSILFMNKILEQHKLKQYFTAVIGIDGTDKQSKKADYVKRLITRYKLKKKETVIVGDTENDIIAAKENYIYGIGITWGYGSESDLIEAKADGICHSPLELKHFIVKNNGKRKTA